MPSYAAFIGHQPHLSLAELAATVPGFLLHEKIDRSVVLFDSASALDAKFLDTLGGTVTLAEKIDDTSYGRAAGASLLDGVPDLMVKRLLPMKGKVTFSLRTMGVAPATIKDLYRKTKTQLKKKGKPSRYVGNEKRAALSIVLREHKLLDQSGGCELTIVHRAEENGASPLLWMGITVGAQDIDAYSTRDMQKPVRDTTTGLLPPKLAQIMINLGLWLANSNQKKDSKFEIRNSKPIVLDPFCGTGVIPMECLMRGFTALASDKSERAVKGCTANLDWLRKTFDIKKSAVASRVWKQDAIKPFDIKENVDVIVTETTLGPGLEKRPTVKEIQKLKSENEALQEDFLRNMAASFPGAPIVCTWPVWYPSKSPIALERVWKVAAELGYQAILPPTIEIVGDRVSLLYRRPDQLVGREIVILRPKKK